MNCNKVIAYTDYPIGNGPHMIREVVVLTYDGNKYCQVKYNGVRYEVKRGYLFSDPELTSPYCLRDR